MGTLEMFEPIAHLAEAAGMQDALKLNDDGYSAYGFCFYVSAARAARAYEDGTTPLGPIGQLYCCVRGEKRLVSAIATYDLDWALGKCSYNEFFEDFDDRLVQEAAMERPDIAEEARTRTIRKLERQINEEAYEAEKTEEKTRTKSIEMRPTIARFLYLHGPATASAFTCAQSVGGAREMENILKSLEKQGFLVSEKSPNPTYAGYGYAYTKYSLSDEAPEMLSCYEPIIVPEDLEGKILMLLTDEGPKSTRELSHIVGLSPERILKALHNLMDDGRVVAKGHSSSRRYLLEGDDRDWRPVHAYHYYPSYCDDYADDDGIPF